MAIVGCTATPFSLARAAGPSGVETIAPHGSRATIADGSYQEGCGPIFTCGDRGRCTIESYGGDEL